MSDADDHHKLENQPQSEELPPLDVKTQNEEQPPADPMPETETQPVAVAPQDDRLNVQIRDGEGSVLQFKIRNSSKLYKLMDAYCAQMSVPKGSFRFLMDGRRITRNDTPLSLEMREMDVIDALVFQSGGGDAIAVGWIED